MTLGSDATGSTFDSSLGYVRQRIAEFKALGTRELPALRQQVTNVWLAAQNAGDGSLAARAQTEFNKVTTAQADWERNNDTLESILGPLRAAGVSLGVIPVAAWVLAATIGIAAAMAAAFVFRDHAKIAIAQLCIESVQKGQLSADDCAKLAPKSTGGLFGDLSTAIMFGGLAYLAVAFFRKRS
jgi:hypothetical protein